MSSDEKRNGHSDFEGFHTQLDCKLTYGNKNQAQLALAFRVQNKTEHNRNDEKYSQTGKTVKIHTNHDGIDVCSG